MSVNPGFGGQAFIPYAAEKIAGCARSPGARPIDIEVDGGITPETAPLVARPAPMCWSRARRCSRAASPTYRANIAAIRNAAALARGEAA